MGHDSQLRELESLRLDSWKEIASFLHRDARTVRRWERERQLPVHRVPGGERSGVFAYVAELERWLHASTSQADVASANGIAPAKREVSPTHGMVPASEGDQDVSAHDFAVTDTSGGEIFLSVGQEETVPFVQQISPLSVFHSLNSFETTLAAETAAVSDHFQPNLQFPPGYVTSRLRHYQVVSLLVLLSVAIGISAGVVRYRETKALKSAVHRPSSEAQDLYLRGRYYWNLRTEEGLNRAVDLFTQSIVNDPNYAEAYAGLADSYLLLRQYGHMPDSEAYPRARAAARQAIALDDSSPEAHRSIAFILRFWNWDMAAAEKEYRRAIELNPNDSQSHHWYATALLSSDRNREALAEIDIARRLEPQSVSVLADRGLILSALDPRAGLTTLQQVEQAQPQLVSTHNYLAAIYLHLGDYANFLAESHTAAEILHDSAKLSVLDRAQRTLGSRGAAAMLRELAFNLAPLADRGATPSYTTARLFGMAGEPVQTLRYLRLACDRREPGFLSVEADPAFDLLHTSAEYSALILRRDASLDSGKQPIARLEAPELSE